MLRRWSRFSLICALLVPGTAVASGSTARGTKPAESPAPRLQIDPRLIAQAAEAWSVIATPTNPIWPGWNASDTPILFYLPGRQDVLINHPSPPAGFTAYGGPVRFPGGSIALRDGPTIIGWDGQNTSRDIEGVRTLVVADALSNLRNSVRGLLEDPRPAAEKAAQLDFPELSTDPYGQLGLIVHEAFHVFQQRVAPDKSANEMLLAYYPVLSVENNVDFALEGEALAAALRSTSDRAVRDAALRWLALRRERRTRLPARAVEYEDGVEFGEGLAKYAEFRLLEALEGRTPRAELWWAQGFHGYDSLASRRSELIETMRRHMRGEVSVNNDQYGTGPLRMRLYFSGMAIAALLDRVLPNWKPAILEPGTTLTGLLSDAVAGDGASRRATAGGPRQGRAYEALVAAKREFARDGRTRIDTMLHRIESGAGTGIVVEYGALETPKVGLAFSPFGITAVDEDRTIYGLVPIQARFPDGSELAQTEPLPLLHDRKARLIRFRLPRELSAEEMARAVADRSPGGPPGGELRLELPGAGVTCANAVARLEGRDLRIVLVPPRR